MTGRDGGRHAWRSPRRLRSGRLAPRRLKRRWLNPQWLNPRWLAITIALGLLLVGSSDAGWQPAIPITATGTESVTGLNHTPLTYDADGGLHLAWAERDTPGQNFQVYARHRPWAEWGTIELVVSYPDPQPGSLLGAKYPSLVAVGDSLHVAWHDYRVGGIFNAEIFTRARSLDGTWGDELRLTTTDNVANPGDNGLVPTIRHAAGELHVLWYDFRWQPETADIFHAQRTAGGWITALGDTADVNVSRGVGSGWNAGAPAVAVEPTGEVHVVWSDLRAGAARIRHNRFTPGGGWGAAATVAEPGGVVEAPTAAILPDGALHVVWLESTGGGKALVTRARSVEGAWGATLLLTDPADLAADPCLIADDHGDLHLVWQDAREGLLNREVHYRRRPAGTGWDVTGQTDVRLSNAPGRSDSPSIAADGRGNLAVLWRDQESGVAELWLREFRPEGPIAVPLEPLGEGIAAWLESPLVRGPNPFAGAVRLDGSVREPVAILSVLGRRVALLPASAEEWDGRNGRGERAAAGIYLLRGTHTGRQARVVLLP